MKKNVIYVLIVFLLLTISGCNSNGKTVNTKEDAQKMAEAFYSDVLNEDLIKMESYSNNELTSIVMKDHGVYYVKYTDPEYGYDFYLFNEDGINYLIDSEGNVSVDEYMYDLIKDTLRLTLDMGVLGYFEADDDSIKYSAKQVGEDELTVTISGNDEGTDYTITSVGKKEKGKVSELSYVIESGGDSFNNSFKFYYDENVILPEYTIPVSYNNLPHVDSPYKTFKDAIGAFDQDNLPFYTLMGNQFIVIKEVDGRHYQLSAMVDDKCVDEIFNLEYDDDYDQNIYNLIADVEIEDCVDFSDVLISQDILDSYIGKTIGDMVNDGFEITGWAFYEDNNVIFVDKDLMTYNADVELEDGFDIETEFGYDDLHGFIINNVKFDVPEYAALPMK